MSTVTPAQMRDCANFLKWIWGTQDQGLYAIVVVQLNPKEENSQWRNFPFKWPLGMKPALKRIFDAERNGHNVYICPALYRKPERNRESVAGSHTLWVDSDGNAPDTFDDVLPAPTMQIQSSYEKNVHHYWLLDEFLDDIDSLETGNRSLAAYMDADASGWDATQLLRPPGTTNRKNDLPVRILSVQKA